MKVILVHNSYQQPGGEDAVFAQECRLLRSRGHEVATYERSNRELEGQSGLERLRVPIQMIWARDAYHQMQALLRRERPQIVHAHNTFMRISPSIFAACREAGVPVVQTLQVSRRS